MDRPRHFLDSPPDVSGPKGAPTAFLGAATRRPPSLPFAQIAAPTRAPPVPTERRHRSLARRLIAVAARRQTTRGFGERPQRRSTSNAELDRYRADNSW